MRRLATPGVLTVTVIAAAGCGLISNAARNLVNEPHLVFQEHRQRQKARSLAREAWERSGRSGASSDFHAGFIDGYADYLEGGRTVDPPPDPPRQYLKSTYQTPTTLRAIEDYFAGFHAGAADAFGSGQRQLMVVPVALPVAGAAATTTEAAPVEHLPPPRPATTPGR